MAANKQPLFDKDVLAEICGGTCGDRRKMPRSEDKLGEVVFEKLLVRIADSKVLATVLARCFPPADGAQFQSKVDEFAEFGKYIHAVVTSEPIGPHHLQFPGKYLSNIVVGVALLDYDGDTIGFFGVDPESQGKGYANALLFATLHFMKSIDKLPEGEVTCKADTKLNEDKDCNQRSAVSYWEKFGMKRCG